MINEKLLTPKEVSDILKIKTTTLANWRYYEKKKQHRQAMGWF